MELLNIKRIFLLFLAISLSLAQNFAFSETTPEEELPGADLEHGQKIHENAQVFEKNAKLTDQKNIEKQNAEIESTGRLFLKLEPKISKALQSEAKKSNCTTSSGSAWNIGIHEALLGDRVPHLFFLGEEKGDFGKIIKAGQRSCEKFRSDHLSDHLSDPQDLRCCEIALEHTIDLLVTTAGSQNKRNDPCLSSYLQGQSNGMQYCESINAQPGACLPPPSPPYELKSASCYALGFVDYFYKTNRSRKNGQAQLLSDPQAQIHIDRCTQSLKTVRNEIENNRSGENLKIIHSHQPNSLRHPSGVEGK